jgi:hypothetical protein
VRYSRPGKVASGVSERMSVEPLSVEVTPGEMAPAEMPGGVTPSAEMPGVMSTEMSTVMVGEVAIVEAPEMSKAAKAVKSAAKTVKATAKAVKTTAEPVKTAPTEAVKAAPAEAVKAAPAVESAAAAVESAAAARRGFAHNSGRHARREGGFEHESESDRRHDDFRPFASHDALLPRPRSLIHDLPETAPNPLHSQFFRRLGDYLAGRPRSSIRITKI